MDNKRSNRLVLIGFGVLLGLLFGLILYLFLENKKLKESVQNPINDLETVVQDTEVENGNKDSNEGNVDQKNNTSISEEDSKERVLWKATTDINSFDGYLNFLRSPDNVGTYKQRCISKLSELGRSGWLYSGRTNDQSTYDEDQLVQVLWRERNAKNLERSVPKIGDIVILKSKDARRTYPDFLPRTNQNGIWPLDNMAYVMDTKMEGSTALIIKVVYKQ